MIRAGAGIRGRQGRVHRRAQLRGKLARFQTSESGIKVGLQLGFCFVDQLAHGGPRFLGHGPHLLHQRGQFAVGSHIAGFGGLKVGSGYDRRKLGDGLGEKSGELVLHGRKIKGSAEDFFHGKSYG